MKNESALIVFIIPRLDVVVGFAALGAYAQFLRAWHAHGVVGKLHGPLIASDAVVVVCFRDHNNKTRSH